MAPGVAAVVPVRSFRQGKLRLASLLPPARREGIGASLAGRVTTAAAVAGMTPLVVTGDETATSWAHDAGFEVLADPGEGLNAACRAGAEWATERGMRWVVLHGDLPLLTAGDLDPVMSAVRSGRDAIAPSSDGGTSMLAAGRLISFAYGPGSFHRHLARLDDPVVVARRGLLHDLDTPADLISATRLGAIS